MNLSPDRDPIDERRLMQTVGGDRQLLAEIVGLFLEDCPGMFERLDEALRLEDGERIWRAAHAIKGSVSNFGAESAASLAARLETAALQASPAEARRLGRALAAEVERVCDRLAGYLDRD